MAKRGVGQRLFRLEIVIGGKRQAFPRKTEVVSCSYLVENRDRGFDHLGPDTVAGNYREGELRCQGCGNELDVGWACCLSCGRPTGCGWSTEARRWSSTE